MQALANVLLGTQNPFKNTDVQVVKTGVKMILPEKMTNEQAIDVLKRKIKEENEMVAIHEEVDAFPLDGAHAMVTVMKQRYGWAQAHAKESFFGPIPPSMVTLEIGHEETTQVVWGSFKVPGVEGDLECGVARKNGMLIFCISGAVKQRFKAEIEDLAKEIRAYVKLNSVYKGKAIRLKTTDGGELDVNNPPAFLDLSRVNEQELTFSDEIAAQVQTNLFTPIEKSALCRQYGVPLKRGVLLEGRYGTGKTLTAYVTAKKARENGWTFIYLDRVSALKSAMLFAKMYGPAVIFAEDIDRAVSGGRSVSVDDILNQIDGVDSKGQELIVILTTNYVENIDKAMLRPGRLDAVISVLPPDGKAAQKLVRLYARGLVAEGENLEQVGKELDGQIPAVIREVVEKSKLAALSHLEIGSEMKLTGPDLLIAAKGMKRHLELMAPASETEPTSEEAFGRAAKKLLGMNGHGKYIEDTLRLTADAYRRNVSKTLPAGVTLPTN